MDKKGGFTHMLKRLQNEVFRFLRWFFGKKVASGRKGKEVLAVYHRIA